MKRYHTTSKRSLNTIQLIIFFICLLIASLSEAQFEWRGVSPLPTGNTINGVAYPASERAVLAGNAGTVLISEGGPLDWAVFDDPSTFGFNTIVDVDFSDSNNGYIMLRGGDQIMKTTTGGEDGWTVANGNGAGISGANNTTVGKEIQVLDANTVVTINSVRAYITTNGGTLWTEITPPGLGSSPQFVDIYFLNASVGYILTRGSGVFKTTDGGNNWAQLSGFTGIQASIVFFADETNGWIVEGTNNTTSNTIHRTTDGGATWSSQDYTGGNLSANELIFTSATEGKLFDRNNVFATSDAGVSWLLEETLPFTPLSVSYSADAEQFLLGGADGALGLYETGSFVSISNSLTNGKTIMDIHFNDLNNGFVATTDNVYRTADAGFSWISLDRDNINDVEFGTSQTGYLFSSTRKVHKTTNGGLTWSEVTSLDEGSYIPQSSDFIDATTGWVAGSNSQVFKTTDGGVSWSAQSIPVPNLTLYDVFFLDANTGYISGSGGYVFKTVDGGANWTNANFPETSNVFEMYWTDVNTGYLATRKIWKTTDGGATWTDDGFSPTGNASDIQFLDANTGFATFQGGVIYQTTDAGDNWNIFTQGGEISQTLGEIYAIDVDNIWVASAKSLFNRAFLNSGTPTSIGLLLPQLDFCPGEEFIATFTANGQLPDETLTLELSDASGSFTSPTPIGSLGEAGTYTGQIEATIPEMITPSTSYRIRAVSPSVTGSDNGYDLSVGGPPTPQAFITSTEEVCKGTFDISYEIEPVEGMSYMWAYSGTGSFNIAGQGTPSISMDFFNSATSGTLSVVLSNGCGDSDPLEMEIIVGTPNAGGAAEGGTTVCAGTSAPELSLSGHTGEIVRWESAVSPFGTYVPIANSNSLTFVPPGTISETTRYRAVVQDAGCGEAVSSFTVVNVSQPSDGGEIVALTGITEISSGTSPGNLSLSGQLGAVVRWERAIAPFTEYDPVATTSTLFNPGILTEDTRFRAVVKNATCPEAISDFLEITILDEAPPQVLSFSPSDEAEEQPINTTLEITFDEDVQSTGQSSVVNVLQQSDDAVLATVELNDPAVADFSGSVLTMTLSQDLPFGTQVYVTVPGNGIEDLEGNHYPGFSDDETWDFETVPAPDVTPPTVVSLSPANGATDVAVNENLVIEFDEDIYLDNDEGTFELRRKSPDQLVEAFDIFGPRVSGGNNSTTITIDPSEDLQYEVEYYFLIGNDVIIDNSDNTFAGITTSSEWAFTTMPEPDLTAPSVVSLSPVSGAMDVAFDTNLKLTFDEDVQLTGSGLFRMYNRSTDELIGTIWSFDSGASVDGNEVTYDIPVDLSYGMEIYVEIENAIEDLAGNPADDILGSSLWHFTVEGESIPPTLLSRSPSSNSENVSVSTDLTLTFDEEVVLTGGGSFRMFNRENDEQIGPNWSFSSGATVTGNTVTYDIPIDLPYETEVYFVITNAIEDLWGNTFESITGNDGWVITTEAQPDMVAPSIVTLTPDDNAVNVPVDQTLEITFDEEVRKGSGSIGLHFYSNNSASQLIDVNSEHVSINGTTVTIDPPLNLLTDIHFWVSISPNAFEDLEGNRFAGINSSNKDDWNFTTSATAPDPPVVVSRSPQNGATDVALDSELSVTFSEPVRLGANGATKQLIIQRIAGGSGNFQVIPLTTEMINEDQLTIPHDLFEEGVTYRIILNRDVIADLDNNSFDGFSGNDWTFSTLFIKEDQSITFDQIEDQVFGNSPFTLSASATSGLDVEFRAVSGPISVNGSTVTILGAGAAVIAANQAGDDEFNPAPEVTESFTIAKADQAITIEAIADKQTTDGPFEVIASVSSGLNLTYAVGGPASISGSTITLDGTPGTITVTVSQSGNENYHEASASVSFEVVDESRQDQTITFTKIEDKTFGDDPFELSATASSGLDVTFTVESGPISISGSTVTIEGAGIAVITASQSGDGDFNPAPEVVETFTIEKADQVILIEPIADKLTSDAPFEVITSVSSGLDLDIEVTGPATISESTITLNGTTGKVTVIVTQDGNENYLEASESITFEVTEEAVLSVEPESAVRFYPNPVSDYLFVESSVPAEITIFDLEGRKLKSQRVQHGRVNLSSLPEGLYLMHIQDEDHTKTEKIFKIN